MKEEQIEISKEDRIASINEEIRELQEQLKGDLSAVHEDILNQIISLLRQRSEVENG